MPIPAFATNGYNQLVEMGREMSQDFESTRPVRWVRKGFQEVGSDTARFLRYINLGTTVSLLIGMGLGFGGYNTASNTIGLTSMIALAGSYGYLAYHGRIREKREAEEVEKRTQEAVRQNLPQKVPIDRATLEKLAAGEDGRAAHLLREMNRSDQPHVDDDLFGDTDSETDESDGSFAELPTDDLNLPEEGRF